MPSSLLRTSGTAELRGRSLGLVVATPAGRGDLARATALALTARQLAVDVTIFFVAEAVAGLSVHQDLLRHLHEAGCTLWMCATSAAAHGLDTQPLGAETGVQLGSQDDHAALVRRADRVVAFT
jgi:sulfur relay (sulfurtransferase) complex TusBCD TusD component (DsrE family)